MIRFTFTINEHRLFIDVPIELILAAKKNFARPIYLWLDDKPLTIRTNNRLSRYRLQLTSTNYRIMRDYYPFTALRFKYVSSIPEKYFLCFTDPLAQVIYSFPLTVNNNAIK